MWVNLILAYAFVFCIYIGIVCYEILQYSCGWLSEPPLHSITHNIHSYLLIIILSIYLLFIVYFINLTENYNLKITLKFIVVGIFIYMAFYIYENFILYAAIFKLYPLFSVIASLFYFLILIVLLYFEFKKDAQKRRKKEK